MWLRHSPDFQLTMRAGGAHTSGRNRAEPYLASLFGIIPQLVGELHPRDLRSLEVSGASSPNKLRK
jgi:hypothetical protein